ncbi:hypothetical protein SUGI_0629080 [Cryptomeria japonica]|nr:hypothetical protein SUGI_0629080 [Cryptomeria japonica]
MRSLYVTKPRHRSQAGREGIEFVHNESPSSYHYRSAESPGRRKVGELHIHQYADHSTTDGGGSLKPTIVGSQRQGLHTNQENGGSHPVTREPHHHGQNRSPLRQHYQGRLGNKIEGASSSCERRSTVEGGTSSLSTPGRSKLRGANARTPETPDRIAPLPKFGDWNEKDPTSADDFTHIFNKKREEKLTGVSPVPAMPAGTPTKIRSHKPASVSQFKSLVRCCMAPRTFD